MDGLTHSLIGLTSAKAGLERLSPYTSAVCILSANAPDIDVVSFFSGGRWTLLQHHRGITHSIVGTLVLGVLIPSIFFGMERAIAGWRKREPRSRYRGLLLASMIAAATHPLMDWTNNYGVRPLLPWDGSWFYGDLVFIVDPYLLLILGGASFLLTSNRLAKAAGWSLLAIAVSIVVLLASPQRVAGGGALTVARIIWISSVLTFALARALKLQKRVGKSLAVAALVLVVLYCGALGWVHSVAYRNAVNQANTIAAQRGERFIRAAAMPTVENPLRWKCAAETDDELDRFIVGPGENAAAVYAANSPAGGDPSVSPPAIERYEKLTGAGEQLVSSASRDPRARVLLGFARFPIAQL